MKKSVVLLVVLLALVMVCVAGAQDTFKIGYACNNFNDTFQTVIEGYAEQFAKDNGIESVGVTWGYGKPEELALASRIAQSPSEI